MIALLKIVTAGAVAALAMLAACGAAPLDMTLTMGRLQRTAIFNGKEVQLHQNVQITSHESAALSIVMVQCGFLDDHQVVVTTGQGAAPNVQPGQTAYIEVDTVYLPAEEMARVTAVNCTVGPYMR